MPGRRTSQFSSGSLSTFTHADYELSERELEVLTLLADAAASAHIAKQLYLSEGTVFNIVSHLLLKLGVEDRTQAAIHALKQGIVYVRK